MVCLIGMACLVGVVSLVSTVDFVCVVCMIGVLCLVACFDCQARRVRAPSTVGVVRLPATRSLETRRRLADEVREVVAQTGGDLAWHIRVLLTAGPRHVGLGAAWDSEERK